MLKKNLTKKTWLILFTLLFCSFIVGYKSLAQSSPSKPNIVLIMTDDQGYGDFGFTGNPDIKTPVLDELANESVFFNQFYVDPVCAPTRASLMTGRSSAKTGVYDTYNGGAMMATQETTIAEILEKNGYKTGIFGKWHLGDNYPMRPQDQGFEESLVHLAGGIGQPGDYLNYFEYDSSYFDPVLVHNGKPIQTESYCSDVYTDYLTEFIENTSGQPFFAYLSFNAPHTPLQLPKKYYDMYADMIVDSTDYPRESRAFPHVDDEKLEDLKQLYGMITNIDDNVGRVLNTLKTNGLEKNTLVIFLTDNGPQIERYNKGLRGRKGFVYEGGIKVPMLMHYPDTFDPNIEVNVPSAHIDILPTLLDLLGIVPPEDIDGRSLLPFIFGGSDEHIENRLLYFYWQRGYPEPYRNVAVRRGPYKLVGNTEHHSSIEDFELFNIHNDPAELNNLVEIKKREAKSLKQNFDNFYNELVKSNYLIHPPRIIVGTQHENPVVLNRNDAKGAPGIWKQDHTFAYWDLEVANSANYDVTIHFLNALPSPGKYVFKIGTVQRTVMLKEKGKSTLRIERIPLEKGKWRLESWYLNDQTEFIAPFTVEIKKI